MVEWEIWGCIDRVKQNIIHHQYLFDGIVLYLYRKSGYTFILIVLNNFKEFVTFIKYMVSLQ